MCSSHNRALYKCPITLLYFTLLYDNRVSCVVNCAVITYNAALNRPAYQSSVYTDTDGTYEASLANDGNHATHLHVNLCVHIRNLKPILGGQLISAVRQQSTEWISQTEIHHVSDLHWSRHVISYHIFICSNVYEK